MARKICNDSFDGNLRCPLAVNGVEKMRRARLLPCDEKCHCWQKRPLLAVERMQKSGQWKMPTKVAHCASWSVELRKFIRQSSHFCKERVKTEY